MGKKFTTFKVNLDGLDITPRWYTIVTQYNYEQKVANDINKMSNDERMKGIICEAFSGIKEIKQEVRNKKGELKIKIINEKVMANYVFVKTKVNPEVWGILSNITGVSAILCVSGVPISTPDIEIEKMRKLLTEE